MFDWAAWLARSEDMRLFLAASAALVWRIASQIISTIPVNRWLVKDAMQRELYILEMEETTESRVRARDLVIAEQEKRIAKLEDELISLIALSSGMSRESTPTVRALRQRRRVQRETDNAQNTSETKQKDLPDEVSYPEG